MSTRHGSLNIQDSDRHSTGDHREDQGGRGATGLQPICNRIGVGRAVVSLELTGERAKPTWSEHRHAAKDRVPPGGLEPPTPGLGNRCSIP